MVTGMLNPPYKTYRPIKKNINKFEKKGYFFIKKGTKTILTGKGIIKLKKGIWV